MQNRNIDLAILARCEWMARIFALAVASLGLAALLGWALDIVTLKSVMTGWATMKANTAMGFLLAGASLFFANRKPDALAWRNLHVALAAGVALLGLSTLGEYLFTVDFGIDQLLFTVDPASAGHALPGRMAMATAAGFALTGLALALLDMRRGRAVSMAAALLANLIGMLAVLGYVYDVTALYDAGPYSSVALHTALGLVVVNCGVLLARPRRGLMAVVTSNTAGGMIARRLLPLALVAPFLIGWLRLEGEKSGLISSEFGITLATITYVSLLTSVIWRTAAVLCASDQKLRDLYQLSPMGIVLTDIKGRHVESNQAFQKMSGYSESELMALDSHTLTSRAYKADEARQFERLARTGLYGPYEQECVRKDGSLVPVQLSGMLIIGSGGQKYICSIVEDITERKQAERAQVQKIVEAAPDPMLLIANNGIITFANRAAQSTFGYPFQDLKGQNVDNLVPLKSRSGHAHYRHLFDISRTQHPMDLKRPLAAMHKDGTEFPVEISLSPFQMDGQPVVIASIRDITERKRAAELLEQSLAQLRRLSDHQQNIKEDERKRIAQDIHDDLGQNLLVLKMDVTMLYVRTGNSHPKLHERVAGVLNNIDATIKSLKSIMNDLRPATLELGLHPAVEWQLKQFERSSGIACKLTTIVPEPEFKLDETMISAVFRILQESLTNVARHAQATEVEIVLSQDERSFSMKVKDNGQGLQPGDRMKANSFGLMGIEERIHSLGGELIIASSPGKGTALSISIPVDSG
ncbi:MAG: PAS domain S-box protein [Glaciimonas sp.]|nr:PAS domain S-box protein [Glaciimonas sp.]